MAYPAPAVPHRRLTEDELAAFEQDGVVCARGLLDRDTIGELREAIEDAIAKLSVLGKEAKWKDRNGFHGDIFVWKLHDAFRDLALFSALPAHAQQILGTPTIRFFYEQFFVKRAGCPVDTPWHQDIPFWPVSGSQIVSFWITLDSVSRASSGLEFVRGSHTWEERFKAVTPGKDPYMMDTDLPEAPNYANLRKDYDVVGWDMEPGDVLIFGPTVMHGADGNHSNEQDRRGLAFRYVGEDVTYAPRHATMPLFWEHNLKAGDELGGTLFPQVWPRVIDSEVERRMKGPEPPSRRQMEAFQSHLADSGFGQGAKETLFADE
ncbi:MAG: phytanoyl-CoA dioxygenase family protein [Pseudomonadota bacterium]|nr:phytanoyl-CoA dioxygenase family protein [Pseudomonadota bacterium]